MKLVSIEKQESCFQQVYLQPELLVEKGILKHFHAIYVGLGELEFLCRPTYTPSLFNFSKISAVVSRLSDSSLAKDDLRRIAKHVKLLRDHHVGNQDLNSDRLKPIFQRKTALSVTITVLTSKVRDTVSEDSIRNLLKLVSFDEGCLIVFSSHSRGIATDVHSVFVEQAKHDGGEETSRPVLNVDKDTEIVVKRQMCIQRVSSLAEVESKFVKVGGFHRQVQALHRLLAQHRSGFKGILLSGPSGCGKSLLLERVAAEARFFLITVHSSDLLRSEPGLTENDLERQFSEAVEHSREGKTILCFDNIEVLCPHVEASSKRSDQRRVLSCLISQLDTLYFDQSSLVVVGVCTKPQEMDVGLRRAGRLRAEVAIGVLDVSEREEVLGELLPMKTNEERRLVAENTPGYLAADLKLLADLLRQETERDQNSCKITLSSLRSVLRKAPPSGFKSGLGIVEARRVDWDSIGGLAHVKTLLRRAIEWPLRCPKAFQALDIQPSKGCLLYGPPGCGKTKLVRAVASISGAVFLSASAASIFSPYVGDSEKAVAELFNRARMAAPSILFIDEIDSLVSSRNESRSSGVKEKVLSTFLNEMDGFGPRNSASQNSGAVMVVCATNRPRMLDDALVRPGRLDQLVYVPPPDREAREEILRCCTRNMKLAEDVDLAALSSELSMFSGADVENLCREAGIVALTDRGMDEDLVKARDFAKARASLKPSLTKEMLSQFEEFERRLTNR